MVMPTSVHLPFLAIMLAGPMVLGNICGLDQCVSGSEAYGTTCCCVPGSCAEDKFDTVTKLTPGLWTIVTRNDPASADKGPAHNRAVIFKLPAADRFGSRLLLVNGVGLCNSSIAGLKALEISENAPLDYVVSSGDWHHVYLKDYTANFPRAKVYVPPGRIPSLEPNLEYELLDVEAPLAWLRPQLQVYPMKGLGQPFDLQTVRYEFFFFHQATRTLTAGDIFFFYRCEPPVGMKQMMPGLEKGRVLFWDAGGSSMFNSTEEGAKSARMMMSLPFERFVHIHGEQGAQVLPGANPSAKELVWGALSTGKGPLASTELSAWEAMVV